MGPSTPRVHMPQVGGRRRYALAVMAAGLVPLLLPGLAGAAPPLGLPPVPVPAGNPQTPEKVALGDKLFHDKRFSSTGDVSCATCHDKDKAFQDGKVRAEGINKLTGTRNGPTVLNAAYYTTFFWDGRSADLEDQSQHPFVNSIEMGLANHDPILKIVRSDPEYVTAFQTVFGKSGDAVTLKEVQQAIAAFERTIISGNSPFDRYEYGGERTALSDAAVRGLDLFRNKGRCVSCHVIEQDQAIFTDNRFHNIGVGVNRIQDSIPRLAPEFLKAKAAGADVDQAVLSNPQVSELGRFAITNRLDDLGSFKTPTLRNVAVTAPFMHDGSIATLADVVEHYNNGGVTNAGDRINDYLSGGIRPLNLTDPEKADLVAFLEALTSPEFAPKAATAANCSVKTPPATTAKALPSSPVTGGQP